MKKTIFLVFTSICAIIAISSCSKTVTYADKLKDERKAISRFLSDHDIDVLDKFPADSTFAKNEYFKDENTGVYFRVDNWGTGEKVADKADVFLRYTEDNILLVSDDTIPGNLGHDYWIRVTYGDESTYMKSTVTDKGDNFSMYLLSAGSILPLKYGVRHGGIVSLIIPFSSGSYIQQYQYEPIFIEELRYRFDD